MNMHCFLSLFFSFLYVVRPSANNSNEGLMIKTFCGFNYTQSNTAGLTGTKQPTPNTDMGLSLNSQMATQSQMSTDFLLPNYKCCCLV